MHDYSLWSERDLYAKMRELEAEEAEIRIEKVAVTRAIEAIRAANGAKPDRFGHNLATELGIAPKRARELAGLALGLESLPEIAKALESGEIEFDVASELVKFATPEDDADIASKAKSWSVSEAEEIARKKRAVTNEEARELHEARTFRWFYDRDKRHINFRALYPAAEGEALIGTVEAEVARADAKRGGKKDSCCDGKILDEADSALIGTGSASKSEQIPPVIREAYEKRCADALIALISSVDVDAARIPTRAQVVLVATASEITASEGAIEVGSGFCSTEVARRLMCDSDIEVVICNKDGRPEVIGANTRAVPKRLSRLIRARDKTCVFPGCGESRNLQIHHIIPASRAGPTTEVNLACVCYFHHHLVHEGGWSMTGSAPEGLVIKSPFGKRYRTGPLRMRLAQAS